MPALEPNSLILVTGATGYIGSHVVDQALALGHRVRASARNQEKADQITSYYATKGISSDRLEVVLVDDFAKDGAWDAAVKGVDGIAHVATVLTLSDKYDEVVPPTIKGATELLASAAKEPSVKRIAFTSSTVTLYSERNPDKVKRADTNTWNDYAVEKAQKEPDTWTVYAASKVLAEKAAWEYVKTHPVKYDLVTLQLGGVFGPFLPSASNQSTGGFLVATQQGNTAYLAGFDPDWLVDVRDAGKLHILALSEASVEPGRLFTVAEPFSWIRAIDAINNTAHPTTVQKPEPKRAHVELDNSRFKELLAPHGGYIKLEQTIADVFP